MNENLKAKLEEIDSQMEAVPRVKRVMALGSIFFGLIIMGYYFYGIDLEEEFHSKVLELSRLEKKLTENKLDRYKRQINKENEKFLEFKTVYERAGYKNTYLLTQLQGIDYLNSDSRGLADLLERILKYSVKLNVEIERIHIEKNKRDYSAHIKEKGVIKIEGVSDFAALLKLLRFIEEQEALISISNLTFKLDQESSKPLFLIHITAYGIVI